MAQTIPEQLPSQASEGEKKLFAVLKRLPQDVVVYYEPAINNRYPDFVVILPTLGVLVIEVKGWRAKEIMQADSQSVRLWQQQREVLKDHPLRQVREYKFALMKRCEIHKQSAELVHEEGSYYGNPKFPFGSFAIFSNISKEQLDRIPGSEEIFPASQVATSDQLSIWQSLAPEAVLDVLSGFFDPCWRIQPMTANQVNILKAILHPEILLALDDREHNESEDFKIKVLDLKQEAIARNIGEGHRLVFGVAGSGKTVILLARAKLICRLNPSARVLVLCFNIPLSATLAEALKQHSATVTVCHFDGWAKTNNIVRDFNKNTDHALLGRRLLDALNSGAPDAGRFDVVLIDEAQDFSAEWYQCVLRAMKDPINGELLIVGDGSQGVYGRRQVSWKQLGVQAQGRTRYLETNYRNTRPILELASLFADKSTNATEDGLQSLMVDPAKTVRTSGYKPVLFRSKNEREEIVKTIGVIHDLINGNWFGHAIEPLRPEQIGILYRLIRKENKGIIEDLRLSLKKLDQEIESIWLNENTDAKRRISEPGVKIMTIHAAKGLQFRAVIMLFSHECPFSGTDEGEERSLFYVGLTRPEDYLVISSSKSSEFISKIETTTHIQIGI